MKWEMLAATKVKMSGRKKKVNRNTYNISSIKRVTMTSLEGYVVVVQNNGKESVLDVKVVSVFAN